MDARLVSKGGEYVARLWRGDSDRLSKPDAEAAAKALAGKTGTVAKLETKAEKEQPPRRFNLNDLQRTGNARHGLTDEVNLAAAQALYEADYLTYPRTPTTATRRRTPTLRFRPGSRPWRRPCRTSPACARGRLPTPAGAEWTPAR